MRQRTTQLTTMARRRIAKPTQATNPYYNPYTDTPGLFASRAHRAIVGSLIVITASGLVAWL